MIPHKYHGLVMGSKGHRVQDITQEFGVSVKFPDRNANADSKLCRIQCLIGASLSPWPFGVFLPCWTLVCIRVYILYFVL